MMSTKIYLKIAIGCFVIGILGFFLRLIQYNEFLGSFLDALWCCCFAILIFDVKKKKRFIIVPLILGYSFELFQLICAELGIYINVYYPGTADIWDVIAYTIGTVLAWIVILVIEKNVK